jgi:glycosyltransferase involved in cell wall biosynthesis
MGAMDPEVGKIQTKLDRLAEAVADLRALVGATYERMEGGRERLERIRESDTWRRAYSEPEPLVTVRIATWNRAELLVEKALASVLRQTYSRWEAVVVGDACTDDTEERLAQLGDPRIRFHNLPVHGPYPEHEVKRWMIAGVPAMNAGLRLANGSWIAPLDDDDEWEDDHLEVLLGAAREGGGEFAYGRAQCTLEGAPIDKTVGAWPPSYGEIDLTASIYNAALREFEHDQVAMLMGEGNDWNLVRRMWEAGVRFEFADRVVSTYAMDHLKGVMERHRGEKEGARE